jgi:ribosomal-protein-alanine N-acetyltransferase
MKTAPQELRTARLLLRSLELTDVPAITRLAGAREIAATTALIPHPYTENNAHDFLERSDQAFREGRTITYAVTAAPQTELCGTVGLTLSPANQRAELGYWIGMPFWGKGYATEAATAVVSFGFDSLGLHRIYAFHFAGNIASKRVLEKIGMLHEGTTRQHIKKWDQFIDLENYGLLGSEFRDAE